MFYRAKLLVGFHALIFFAFNIIYAIFTYKIGGEMVMDRKADAEVSKRLYTYLFFLLLIMIINMWEILGYWIDSREKEFYIHRMVGATKGKVFWIYFLDYLKIVIASLVLGIVLCFLYSFLPFEYSDNILKYFHKIKWMLAMSYLVPMFTGGIILWRQQNVDGFK